MMEERAKRGEGRSVRLPSQSLGCLMNEQLEVCSCNQSTRYMSGKKTIEHHLTNQSACAQLIANY